MNRNRLGNSGLYVSDICMGTMKQHDFVASTIVGAPSVDQFEEMLPAIDLVLDQEILLRVDEIDEAIPNPMTEDGLRRL